MKVREVKPGFEKEAELILQKKEVLAAEKEVAVKEALKRVDEEFIEKENTIVSILGLITVEVEVEDPEEVVEAEVEVEGEVTEDEVLENEQPQEVKPIQSGAISPSQLKFG